MHAYKATLLTLCVLGACCVCNCVCYLAELLFLPSLVEYERVPLAILYDSFWNISECRGRQDNLITKSNKYDQIELKYLQIYDTYIDRA